MSSPSVDRLQLDEIRRYELDVLELSEDRTEDDLDQQYLHDAEALGIDSSQSRPSPPSCVSSSTVSSRARRSDSASSHHSASTGLTSNFSRNSKDFQATPTSPPHSSNVFGLSPQDQSSASIPSSPTVRAPTPSAPSETTPRPISSAHFSPIALHRPFSVRRGFSRFARLKRASQSSEPSTYVDSLRKPMGELADDVPGRQNVVFAMKSFPIPHMCSLYLFITHFATPMLRESTTYLTRPNQKALRNRLHSLCPGPVLLHITSPFRTSRYGQRQQVCQKMR